MCKIIAPPRNKAFDLYFDILSQNIRFFIVTNRLFIIIIKFKNISQG